MKFGIKLLVGLVFMVGSVSVSYAMTDVVLDAPRALGPLKSRLAQNAYKLQLFSPEEILRLLEGRIGGGVGQNYPGRAEKVESLWQALIEIQPHTDPLAPDQLLEFLKMRRGQFSRIARICSEFSESCDLVADSLGPTLSFFPPFVRLPDAKTRAVIRREQHLANRLEAIAAASGEVSGSYVDLEQAFEVTPDLRERTSDGAAVDAFLSLVSEKVLDNEQAKIGRLRDLLDARIYYTNGDSAEAARDTLLEGK